MFVSIPKMTKDERTKTMTMSKVNEKLRKEYKSIFDKLEKRGREHEYAWFQAQGNPKSQKRLMVVGRAVRGWAKYHVGNDNFNALYSPKISPFCPDGDIETYFREDSGYNINRSAFWRTARIVACGLYNCKRENFGNALSYSNLYKVALPDKNPDSELIKIQQMECIEILRQEIQLFKPANILFLTGWEWADPFLADFEKNDGLKCPKTVPKYDRIEIIGAYPNGCRIAVIPHPQGKEESLLANQVIAFFRE